MDRSRRQPDISPWPHRWAVVLACATFPLVWVGGLVTTTDAGMAVPDWPSTYGYNLFLYPWQSWLLGPWDLFIEHGHRLLAATVGLVAIVLAASLWQHDRRTWVRRLGLCALVLVIAQGVLGGMRVLMDERMLAMIHACTGPFFFTVTVALAVVTSRSWRNAEQPNENSTGARSEPHPQALNLQALAVLTAVCVFCQIVLGAMLRHVPVGATPGTFATFVQFHLLLAGVLTLLVVLLVWLAHVVARQYAVVRRLSWLTIALLVVQLGLGVATWAAKYSVAQWAKESSWLAAYTIQAGSWVQTHIVTAHVAIGSLLLAVVVALALYTVRLAPAQPYKPSRVTRLMEVAV